MLGECASVRHLSLRLDSPKPPQVLATGASDSLPDKHLAASKSTHTSEITNTNIRKADVDTCSAVYRFWDWAATRLRGQSLRIPAGLFLSISLADGHKGSLTELPHARSNSTRSPLCLGPSLSLVSDTNRPDLALVAYEMAG